VCWNAQEFTFKDSGSLPIDILWIRLLSLCSPSVYSQCFAWWIIKLSRNVTCSISLVRFWRRTRARLSKNRNTAQLCTSISSNAVCEWVRCNMYDRLTQHNSSIALIEKFQCHHSIFNNMYWLSRTKKIVCFHVVLIKTRVLIDDVNIIYTVWQNNTISNISALLINNLYERISRWEWLVKRVTKTHVSIYNIRIVIINYIFYYLSGIFPYLPILIL